MFYCRFRMVFLLVGYHQLVVGRFMLLDFWNFRLPSPPPPISFPIHSTFMLEAQLLVVSQEMF